MDKADKYARINLNIDFNCADEFSFVDPTNGVVQMFSFVSMSPSEQTVVLDRILCGFEDADFYDITVCEEPTYAVTITSKDNNHG